MKSLCKFSSKNTKSQIINCRMTLGTTKPLYIILFTVKKGFFMFENFVSDYVWLNYIRFVQLIGTPKNYGF